MTRYIVVIPPPRLTIILMVTMKTNYIHGAIWLRTMGRVRDVPIPGKQYIFWYRWLKKLVPLYSDEAFDALSLAIPFSEIPELLADDAFAW